MKKCLFYVLVMVSVTLSVTCVDFVAYAFDPEIEAVIKKAYELTAKGDRVGVLNCCHTEIAQYKGSFDTGYSPGRSGSLGELPNLAMGVESGEEKLSINNLKIEVIKEEGERAIAVAKYHAIQEYKSSLSWEQGKPKKDEWDAEDYIILKKQKGKWKLRRLEDRAGHFISVDLQQQLASDPYGGVK